MSLAPLGRGMITAIVKRGLKKSPTRMRGVLNLPPWVKVGVRYLLSKYSFMFPPLLPRNLIVLGLLRPKSCNSPPHSAKNKAKSWAQESQAGPGLAIPLLSGGYRHTQPHSAPAEVEREGDFPRGCLHTPSTAGSLSLPPRPLQPAQHLN